MRTSLEKIREEIKSGQEEIRSIFIDWIADMKVVRLETNACLEETEAYTEKIQPDSRMMQSLPEHKEAQRKKPQ
jgi:hypothetical protein